MKSKILKYLLSGLVFWAFTVDHQAFGQEENVLDNYKMYFKFYTTKQADNSRLLEVSFEARNKKDRKDKVPVYQVGIDFYNVFDGEELLLGSAKTNKDGIAKLILPQDQSFQKDEEGFINLIARFEGTDALDSEEDEIQVKDINLSLNLTEVDSVRQITVNAYTLDSVGEQVPVEEAVVNLFVGGMLSKMKIEEGNLEDGEFTYELKSDFPGDHEGNITIIAAIQDDDNFGNVNQKEIINWGNANKLEKAESNTLWSEAAPIWMYVVLTILLVGVWFNYVYTVINLFKIKKLNI